jgi:hypothetical protein
MLVTNSYLDIVELSWPWSYGSWIYNYLCNHCLSPPMLWVPNPTQMRCTWYIIMWQSLSVTCGLWFSPGTLISSTNRTDHHNKTEILLKVALNTVTLPLTLSYSLFISGFEIFACFWFIQSNVVSEKQQLFPWLNWNKNLVWS